MILDKSEKSFILKHKDEYPWFYDLILKQNKYRFDEGKE